MHKLHLRATCCLCKIINKDVNCGILGISSSSGKSKNMGECFESPLCWFSFLYYHQFLPRGSLFWSRNLSACGLLSRFFFCVKVSFLKKYGWLVLNRQDKMSDISKNLRCWCLRSQLGKELRNKRVFFFCQKNWFWGSEKNWLIFSGVDVNEQEAA